MDSTSFVFQPAALPAEAAGAASDAHYSTESIAYQSVAVQLGAWLLFATLSAIIGTFVLIMPNPSFGTLGDLLLCLLWGVGLPATAQGLSGQTGGSIATLLGIRLTRPA